MTEAFLDGGEGVFMLNTHHIVVTSETQLSDDLTPACQIVTPPHRTKSPWTLLHTIVSDRAQHTICAHIACVRWRPVEVDTPLRKLHWFWHPHDESSLKSVNELIDSYENSVGSGGQWMVGLAPDNRGLLPDADVSRLREQGEAIRSRYSRNLLAKHLPVDGNVTRAIDGNPDTFWSAPAGSKSATIEVRLPKPITFDHALTMEWLVDGQRIQKCSIEAWLNGKWMPVASSFAIGHKKIDHFAPVTTDRVRLNILTSDGDAHIRESSVFSGQGKLTRSKPS